MSIIYDINYNIQAPELMPPDKRDNNTVILVQSILSGMQWCRNMLFTSYKTGATAPNYATGTYALYSMVVYQKAVYYSLVALNTALPSDATKWLKVQDNFLGVDQRVLFNGQNLVLEYALNLQFGGTFRPPGSSSPSDINMVNVAAVVAGFRVGKTEPFSQSVGQTLSSATIGNPYPFVQINNFQINFLTALFILTTDKAVRNFVNLYIPISLNYTIVTY